VFLFITEWNFAAIDYLSRTTASRPENTEGDIDSPSDIFACSGLSAVGGHTKASFDALSKTANDDFCELADMADNIVNIKTKTPVFHLDSIREGMAPHEPSRSNGNASSTTPTPVKQWKAFLDGRPAPELKKTVHLDVKTVMTQELKNSGVLKNCADRAGVVAGADVFGISTEDESHAMQEKSRGQVESSRSTLNKENNTESLWHSRPKEKARALAYHCTTKKSRCGGPSKERTRGTRNCHLKVGYVGSSWPEPSTHRTHFHDKIIRQEEQLRKICKQEMLKNKQKLLRERQVTKTDSYQEMDPTCPVEHYPLLFLIACREGVKKNAGNASTQFG
jgi:hypothetical protein